VTPGIVGIGMATMDRLYLLDDCSGLPHRGTVLQYSVQGGGPAATAMAATAVLGGSCGMVAVVGNDDVCRDIIAGLAQCGVDTSHCAVRQGTDSPVVVVLVDVRTGDRHFLGHKADSPMIGMDDVDWDYVAGASVAHFDGWINRMPQALQRARSPGTTVMVDANVLPGLEPDWLSLVDVYIGSADTRERRLGPEGAIEEAEAIRALGPHTAIVTMGADGCAGVGAEGPFSVPGFKVDVVDTTGTGDVFHGAYAYALHEGWDAEQCAVFASATAAISATKLGGRAALPTTAQVAQFLSSRGHEGPWGQ